MRTNKTSILALSISVLFPLLTIVLIYSDFSKLPNTVLFDTTHNTKYAVGFFFVPVIVALLSLGALLLRLNNRSRNIAQFLTQVALLVSGGLTIWWLVFESGFLPAMFLVIPLVFVVINDVNENKQRSISGVS